MERLGIGLLGFGTVGSGVVRILSENAKDIEARLGARIDVRRIAVQDLDKPRAAEFPRELMTTDPRLVLDDPAIRIVVELVGGTTDARAYVLQAIGNRKHVVTANKALLAIHGDEVFRAASEHGVDVFYEAAVGGGIPIIRTMRESLASERVQRIVGILNGTTNFILTRMSRDGASFEAALREAQAKGYAEADPTADVDGHDAAQKLAILASLGFSARLSARDVAAEGIRSIKPADIQAAEAHGYAIKLVAVAERKGEQVAARVHPAWVPEGSMLAHVDGVLNAVLLESDALGTSLLVGQGAGQLPTGSAVAADIIDLSRNILLGSTGRVPHLATRDEALRPAALYDKGELSTPYYLRFTVLDSPGVLARIAGALGEQGVSLRVVEQDTRGAPSEAVPVVVITHEAPERAVRAAVARIDAMETTRAPTHLVRILDL